MNNSILYRLIKYLGPGYLLPWIQKTLEFLYEHEIDGSKIVATSDQRKVNTYSIKWLGMKLEIQAFEENIENDS